MNIIKYVGILHVGNERDNTHNPLKQRFHAMFSIVHIFHKIGFSFTEHYTRSFSFIGFFLVSVSEGLLISSRKRALHFSSFYEPRSSSPRGKEKRKETATGKRVTRVMTIAHASILTTFSRSWFSLILGGGIFFSFLHLVFAISSLPSRFALSFSAVWWVSSPTHDKLTRGKEREGRDFRFSASAVRRLILFIELHAGSPIRGASFRGASMEPRAVNFSWRRKQGEISWWGTARVHHAPCVMHTVFKKVNRIW